MNESAFKRFGIFVAAFRVLMAIGAIVKIALTVDMKNQLIDPIREWMSDVIFYSFFYPVLVLTGSVVELLDYTMKNVHSFKKATRPKQNIKFKSYMFVTAIESTFLFYYCFISPYTFQMVSTEVENTLHSGLGKYLTNLEWRLFWNQFQLQYDCCGAFNSTDWFQTPWASPIDAPPSLLKKYIQENGKFIIPVAPTTCCLNEGFCSTFADCEHSDPELYHKNGCFSVIDDAIGSIASTIYLFYVVLILKTISAIVKYEGFTDKNNPKSKL